MEISTTEPFGKDVFLRLLTTQLKYQDPLAPVGSTEFVAQLAQFTELEQTATMNETLTRLVELNGTLNNYGAANLIGKEVQVLGGSIQLSEDVQPAINYRLARDANTVLVQISDSAGKVVRILQPGPQGQGLQSLTWDGLDTNNNPLPDAEYQFDISAADIEGISIGSTTFSDGKVTGVAYEDGVPYLIVNGNKVPAASVTAVNN